MAALSCAIIGDVNIDYITDLSEVDFLKLSNSCLHQPITTSIGGNGVFFAETAHEAGFQPINLICSIGNDHAGKEAKQYCEKFGVNLISQATTLLTGKVLILYQKNDQRLLIADRGANRELAISATQLPNEILETTDLLYISGYFLIDTLQRQATLALAHEFRTFNTFVILDIVPHDIHELFSFDEYISYCDSIDGIVTEAATLAAFFHQNAENLDLDSIVNKLITKFKLCIIRINSNSDFYIATKNHRRIVTIPYVQNRASLRFTDRVIAQIMFEYLIDQDLIFSSDQWIDRTCRILSTQLS